MGDDNGDFGAFVLSSESVGDGLGEPVADLALTHGDCRLERHGGNLSSGGGFFVNQNIANLRPIAMCDDNFVSVGEASDEVADFLGNFFLSVGGVFAVFL